MHVSGGTICGMRRVALLLALLTCCAVPATASAQQPTALGLPCAPSEGVRFCTGKVDTWDEHVVAANVTLPATGDGPFPLIMLAHGWGGSKFPLGKDRKSVV